MTRRDGTVRLSERLRTLADMVPEGVCVADVGCDHGFLDIELVQRGKAKHAIAMDVRKGPLASAAAHVDEAGLGAFIETRLSDGLEKYLAGEAQVLVIAGMGGPLMQRILTAYPEKTESFREMILQPQSEIREFRVFLREQGYKIVEERILLEDGKYYFPMRVKKAEEHKTELLAEQELFDRYGEHLLMERSALIRQYLTDQKSLIGGIADQLSVQLPGNEDEGLDRREKRMAEIREELEGIQRALAYMDDLSESG